jgi:small multidrug resistance family-3 protein
MLFGPQRRGGYDDAAHRAEWLMIRTALAFAGAAIAEIAGCYGFWLWLRQGKSVWLLPFAFLSLALFAWLLTLAESATAGRAYAAYGGVYISAALLWLWWIEGVRPDRWDVIGAGICLVGAAVILFAPRTA